MRRTFDPFRLLLISVAGWLGQQQRDAIDYLREENRVLREQLGGKRLRLNDDQRRRLAAKAKMLGRRILREVSTIVTPKALLAWQRKLELGTRGPKERWQTPRLLGSGGELSHRARTAAASGGLAGRDG